jgi:hypothetical protein
MPDSSPTARLVSSSNEIEGSINVTIAARFLELFSENLYSSPNKAFEELVSNSWDAGADCVYISIPPSIIDTSSIWVLDNGESMDFHGLEQLWAVASDTKRQRDNPPRRQIGKFGIGKLATYILANEVTYVCRSSDGTLRAVTLDYRRYGDSQADKQNPLHVDPLPLKVHKLSDSELLEIVSSVEDPDYLKDLISRNVPHVVQPAYEAEFGGEDAKFTRAAAGTWTLVLLTSLKAPAF